MKDRIAVYAGSFDPVTLGHQNMIEKARRLFDHVYVVLAVNPSKQGAFESHERFNLLNWMKEDGGYSNVTVTVLGPQYVVSWAKEQNAQFLVRGVRDVFDYAYESQIYEMNKSIEGGIETVYLMPDTPFRVVSSSTVKGLVGFYGWQKEVSKHVSQRVLHALAEWHVKKRFMEYAEYFDKPEFTWNKIRNHYSVRPYHNMLHVARCLELFDKYGFDLSNNSPVVPAMILHDVEDDEDDSVKFAHVYMKSHTSKTNKMLDSVKRIIIATQHASYDEDNPLPKSSEEELAASIDLAILGSGEGYGEGYEIYESDIRREYYQKGVTEEQWNKGRADFLQSMLSRKVIFAHDRIREDFEEQARYNISFELRDCREGLRRFEKAGEE